MSKRDKEVVKKTKSASGRRENGKGEKEARLKDSVLSSWTKRWIKAILLFLVAIIVVLSFPSFGKAGYAGQILADVCIFLIGKAFYTVPLFLFIAGLIFLKTRKKGKNLAMTLAVLTSLVGMAGILAVTQNNLPAQAGGGFIGYWLARLFVGLFGMLVANIIFGAVLLIGLFMFLQFIWQEFPKKEKGEKPTFAVNRQEEENVKIKGLEAEKQKEQEKPKPALASKITLFKKGNEEPEKADIRKPATENKNNYVLLLKKKKILNVHIVINY